MLSMLMTEFRDVLVEIVVAPTDEAVASVWHVSLRIPHVDAVLISSKKRNGAWSLTGGTGR
jgi:hypothetical protein